jgi:protein SCO1/2
MRSRLRLALIALCGVATATLTHNLATGSKIGAEYPAELTAFDTVGGSGLPYLVGKDMRPVWNLAPQDQPRFLHTFKMRDQLGEVIGTDQLRGKIVIVSFFFAQCSGICPMAMGNLATVQKKFLGDDRIVLVSFTITPELDTPDRLRVYAEKRGIPHRQWKLVTGERDLIYRLARESFSADTALPSENAKKKLTPKDFLHSENVFLLDPELKVRGAYSGRMPGSMLELIASAETLRAAIPARARQ